MTTAPDTPGDVPNRLVGMRPVEPVLKQFLEYQMRNISDTIDNSDAFLINELFEGYGKETVASIKDWFREHTNIEVTLNYPRHDLQIPFISVVNGFEHEKEGEQYLGDHGGYQIRSADLMGGGPAVARKLMSIPQTHQTQIFIAADDPNLALYLYTVVRALIYVNKTDFNRYVDMRNLVLSGQDLQFRPELFPTFAYFKVIVLTYDTSFDIAGTEVCTIGGVDVSLKAATRNFTVISQVPED